MLKCAYGCKLKDLIRAHITHITKLEFLVAFKLAHFKAIILENIKASF